MANRVLFGNAGSGKYGLYISKPGFNVLTAVDEDLLFSSDWRNPSVYLRGVSNVNPRTTPYTISFGKTFSTRPLVLMGVRDGSADTYEMFVNDRSRLQFTGPTQYPSMVWWAQVTNTDIQFRSVAPSSVTRRLYYVVWDMSL